MAGMPRMWVLYLQPHIHICALSIDWCAVTPAPPPQIQILAVPNILHWCSRITLRRRESYDTFYTEVMCLLTGAVFQFGYLIDRLDESRWRYMTTAVLMVSSNLSSTPPWACWAWAWAGCWAAFETDPKLTTMLAWECRPRVRNTHGLMGEASVSACHCCPRCLVVTSQLWWPWWDRCTVEWMFEVVTVSLSVGDFMLYISRNMLTAF